ncbi:MAG: type II secretion system protein GspC [Steroidobacteraceae bacterium]
MSAASWLQAIPVSEKWRALFFTRGPRVATWLLALAIGVQAAMIVTDLAGADRAPSPGMIAAASRVQRSSVDIAAITNTHLFGVSPTAAGAGDVNAPQTSMPLVLTGVIAANDPREGLAILGPSVAATQVYAVGDNIPGGARLHAVLTDHVLLERDGRIEALALPRQLAGSALSPDLSAAPAQPAFEQMRQLVSRDPGIIGDIMRPEPVFAGGKQRGFRVYPGRDPQMFLQLGLRPGDLVTAIDGTPLDDPARGEQILQTLGASSEAHVTILRNGQQQDLTLDLATVEQEAESLAGPQNGASAPPPPQRSMPFAPPQSVP